MAAKKAWLAHLGMRPRKSAAFALWQTRSTQLRNHYDTVSMAASPEVRAEVAKREEIARNKRIEDIHKADAAHRDAAYALARTNAVASGSNSGTNVNAVASGSGTQAPPAHHFDRSFFDDYSDSDRDSSIGGMVNGLYLGDGDYGVEGLARDRDRAAYDAAYGSRYIAMTETERRDFFERAVNEADFSENATVQSARAALGLTDAQPKLKGMLFALLPHQIIGVDWAIQKEERDRGGLLGDEMGLGSQSP